MKAKVLIAATLMLVGCGPRDAEVWHARKAQCAGGDYPACADLGHMARAAQGGTTLERDPEYRLPLSEPIVD